MNNKTNYLLNKTVVITGASSGAGRATAIEFARHGARLVLAARNIDALEELAKECQEMGSTAIAVQADVSLADEVKRLAEMAKEFGGTVDVWVNNAGVLAIGEFTETPIEIHDKVIKTNLLGYIHGAHAVLPYFKAQGFGTLINNISVGAWIAVPYGSAYSSSKFGLKGFFDALRGELRSYPGISICNMYPAFLDTPGTQHAANFTGKIVRPAPPVYDPQGLARAIVETARNPKPSVTYGSAAYVMKLANLLFPGITNFIISKVVETYLKKASPALLTAGNVHETALYGTSIHGGWNSPADIEIRKKAFIKSVILTTIVGALFVLGGKKLLGKSGKAA